MENNDNKIASYQAKFHEFLTGQKYDFQAVKSASADLQHYFDWFVKSTLKSKIQLSRFNLLSTYFNIRALQQYLDLTLENNTATSFLKIVRSIQIFLDFSSLNKWLPNNVSTEFKKLAKQYQQSLKYQEQQTTLFAQYLKQKGVSKNTLRSYLADIKEYLVIN